MDGFAPVLQLWQRAKNSRFELRQVVCNRFPDHRQFDSIVLVTQPVPQTSDVPPQGTRSDLFGIVPKPNRSLTDDLKFALDGCHSFGILTERVEINVKRKLLDHLNGVQNIPE